MASVDVSDTDGLVAAEVLPEGTGNAGDDGDNPSVSFKLATCADPSSRAHRFIVLFFLCFLAFGESEIANTKLTLRLPSSVQEGEKQFRCRIVSDC